MSVTTDIPLYQAIADRLADDIAQGVYAVGDRLPSVRALSENEGVSVSTALQVYRTLETRGYASARPKSGYYVGEDWQSMAAPRQQTPPNRLRATEISVNRLLASVLSDIGDPGILQLGAAIPAEAILPGKALARLTGRVARETAGANRYCMWPGLEALRLQICRLMATRGVHCSPADVMITSGCHDALSAALRAVCRPGETVAVESPTYFHMLQAMESFDLRALEIPCDPTDHLDLAALEQALKTQKVSAILCTPEFHNPLGCRMSEARKEQLVALAERYDVTLIEDDINGDLAHDGSRARACKAFDEPGDAGRVVYCSSFSKTIGPGARIGWLIGGRHHQDILESKSMTNHGQPYLEQAVIAQYLQEGQYARLLPRLQRLYADQVMRSRAVIANHFPAGTCVTRPEGGFLLWVELPPLVDALELYDLARRDGVGFIPGNLFSATGNLGNCLRLSCGLEWSEPVSAALYTLGRLASQLAARSG